MIFFDTVSIAASFGGRDMLCFFLVESYLDEDDAFVFAKVIWRWNKIDENRKILITTGLAIYTILIGILVSTLDAIKLVLIDEEEKKTD